MHALLLEAALTSEPMGLAINRAGLNLEPQLLCDSSSDLGVLVLLRK